MPMSHRTQMQIIKRRLTGKEGSERVRELRAILDELPGYRNGPYADLRNWVNDQIEESRLRRAAVHRDSIAVRREGAAQIGLVGPPNAGKSSLLQALSDVQIKIGNYAFTTLRPVPALTRIGGVLVQLVEIPGLIAGAAEDRGGGRAFLGVLRSADAIVYCQGASGSVGELGDVLAEVTAAGISLPAMLAVTRMDEAREGDYERVRSAAPALPVVPVSVLDDASLEALRQALWRLTGLMRVYLRVGGRTDEHPLALPPGACVRDAARAVHSDVAAACKGARVRGPSARFEGQRVGAEHVLLDGDAVEVLT